MIGPASAEKWRVAILYCCVAAGSVIGGLARYLVSLLLLAVPGLPWATLFVNVTGSFIIGFYATLSGPDGRLFASARQRQFVITGFCGGFTTFSTFSVQAVIEVDAGEPARAIAYVAASVIGGLLAATAGYALGRSLA